jgi:hypothetical protein
MIQNKVEIKDLRIITDHLLIFSKTKDFLVHPDKKNILADEIFRVTGYPKNSPVNNALLTHILIVNKAENPIAQARKRQQIAQQMFHQNKRLGFFGRFAKKIERLVTRKPMTVLEILDKLNLE